MGDVCQLSGARSFILEQQQLFSIVVKSHHVASIVLRTTHYIIHIYLKCPIAHWDAIVTIMAALLVALHFYLTLVGVSQCLLESESGGRQSGTSSTMQALIPRVGAPDLCS